MLIIINGFDYQTSKLSAMEQVKVGKRMLPIIGQLAAMFGSEVKDDDLVALLEPITKALAALPDADLEMIMGTCLAHVQRRETGGWAVVWNRAANLPMYADLDLMALLQLMWSVLRENFAPFIAGLPKRSDQAPQPAPSA